MLVSECFIRLCATKEGAVKKFPGNKIPIHVSVVKRLPRYMQIESGL